MTRVAIYGSFDSLPQSCEALFRSSSARLGVFLSLPWFQALSTGALDESGLRIFSLESGTDKAVHALMPMCRIISTNKFFTIRRLAATANFYTPLFSPLIADNASARDCLKVLVKEIATDPACWDTVAVYPLDRDAPLFASMLAAFRSAGMAVQPYLCFGNWYLKVNGRSYDEYATSLPTRLRNTLNRKAQQLGAGRLRIDIITSGDDVDQGIDVYHAVYRASWKSPEAHPRFMPELIRTCAEQGWLRLGIAYIDGRPAAAQVWIVADSVASIYKLAYDQEFTKYSVGSLVTARLMRHVIDVDRVHEVDFLSGDDAYKADWMSHRRERWGIMAFNLRTLKGIALAVKHKGGRLLKHSVRNFISRQAAL